jgi:hypothetical protein
MIKSVGQEPIHSLLSPETNVTYDVPRYQREYSWSKEQWDALFDDLVEEGPESGHFLGTIICVNKTTNSTSRTILELVDGQQRMTTISIFLLAVFNQLKSREEDLDDEQKADLATLRKMLCLKGKNAHRLRLQKQNKNADDYEYLLNKAGFDVETQKSNNIGNRRISKALRHLNSRIEKYLIKHQDHEVDALLDLFNMVKQSVLVKIEVESYSDAFTLFESLNNRGLPLTPIDLIKTSLLSIASKRDEDHADRIYESWKVWLDCLGDDYGAQERFFRQFYNAFKSDWNFAVAGVPVATKSKLIRVYDRLLQSDLDEFVERMDTSTRAYGRIVGNRDDDESETEFDVQLRDLTYAQGTPSFMLLLFLLVNVERFKLSIDDLAKIAKLLVSFAVRRNITNTPPTNDLDRLFISIIEKIPNCTGDLFDLIRSELIKVSADDSVFDRQLRGPIYEENSGSTRFLLVKLAEQSMTKESKRNLWERQGSGAKQTYVWSIEHILPQGENLPSPWIEMLGGAESAKQIQSEYTHTLGNLTITAFNSTLGNKSFEEKRGRTDSKGRFVGYLNGISLNEDLVNVDSWSVEQISARTEKLVSSVKELFVL